MTVIAGNGFRVSECRPVIMQFDRFNARRFVRVARLSGISVKRLLDKSSECNVPAKGARPAERMKVMLLSARLRCLRKRHLLGCRVFNESRFEELVRGVE